VSRKSSPISQDDSISMYCVSYHCQTWDDAQGRRAAVSERVHATKDKRLPGKNRTIMPSRFLGTIIIVSHNSGSCIAACLQALVPLTQWKIVLVDNNSTDDSVRQARAVPLEVHTLINSHNAGFAGAVNQAAKVAEGD